LFLGLSRREAVLFSPQVAAFLLNRFMADIEIPLGKVA
jgi:hypothetical protein